jgi:hypothetical protein
MTGLFTFSALIWSGTLGCQPNFSASEVSVGDVAGDAGGDNTTTPEDPVDEAWDTATLVVTSPLTGDFLPLGEPADFVAEVRDAEGELMDWDAISWSSDVDNGWAPEGADFEDDGLAVGRHNLQVQTTLPNGDRLVYTVGGVLVQHEDAGTYVGDANIDLASEYDGTAYTMTCIGAVILFIDAMGEKGTGETSCTLALMGYDMDVLHIFDLDIQDGQVSGSTSADFSFFAYSFDTLGEVADGQLGATWADNILGYADIAGELDLARISRDTQALD